MVTELASLTWKLRRANETKWKIVAVTLPPETAARVAVILLREFAGKTYDVRDVSVLGDQRRFAYRSDEFVILLRRFEGTRKENSHG